VSNNPKLTDLFCDAELFTENKIIGLEKTSILRLDFQGGDLLRKSPDPRFIWEVFVRKYNFAFPEMKLIEITDLNELAQQVNSETIQNEEFLRQFCSEEVIERNKGEFYWILDTLANQILARCVVIQNRLYTKKIEKDYEEHLIELTQNLECHAMNPLHPQASLRTTRERLINQTLNGDIELLTIL